MKGASLDSSGLGDLFDWLKRKRISSNFGLAYFKSELYSLTWLPDRWSGETRTLRLWLSYILVPYCARFPIHGADQTDPGLLVQDWQYSGSNNFDFDVISIAFPVPIKLSIIYYVSAPSKLRKTFSVRRLATRRDSTYCCTRKKSLLFLILLCLYRATLYFGTILERMVALMLKHGTPLALWSSAQNGVNIVRQPVLGHSHGFHSDREILTGGVKRLGTHVFLWRSLQFRTQILQGYTRSLVTEELVESG